MNKPENNLEISRWHRLRRIFLGSAIGLGAFVGPGIGGYIGSQTHANEHAAIAKQERIMHVAAEQLAKVSNAPASAQTTREQTSDLATLERAKQAIASDQADMRKNYIASDAYAGFLIEDGGIIGLSLLAITFGSFVLFARFAREDNAWLEANNNSTDST